MGTALDSVYQSDLVNKVFGKVAALAPLGFTGAGAVGGALAAVLAEPEPAPTTTIAPGPLPSGMRRHAR